MCEKTMVSMIASNMSTLPHGNSERRRHVFPHQPACFELSMPLQAGQTLGGRGVQVQIISSATKDKTRGKLRPTAQARASQLVLMFPFLSLASPTS